MNENKTDPVDRAYQGSALLGCGMLAGELMDSIIDDLDKADLAKRRQRLAG